MVTSRSHRSPGRSATRRDRDDDLEDNSSPLRAAWCEPDRPRFQQFRSGLFHTQTTHAKTMSVSIPLLTQIAQTNRKSAHRLNMSVKTYSLLKILVRLLAIAAGIYAMSLDADPTWIFTIIGLIVIGPDLLETAVAEDGLTISIDDGDGGG